MVGLAVWGCARDERERLASTASPSVQPEPAKELTGAELGKKLSLHYVMNRRNVAPMFQSTFLGITTMHPPTDMWLIQEIITEIQPDFIIEAGTFAGGSALYYASILKEVNPRGRVITIDIEPIVDEWMKKIEVTPYMHERVEALFNTYVELITSNSVDPTLIEELAERVKGKKVVVSLDSCHNYEHVLKELELYSPMVSVGSYIIVQDTIIDEAIAAGSKLAEEAAQCPGYEKKGGPGKALKEFLAKNENFSVDEARGRFLVTWFPSGYVKRTR
jgi:cephalosporin hydroxylase